jgi:pimeloyl-ACP methyl ester carboxylesterase
VRRQEKRVLPKAHYAKRLTAVLAILCIFRIAAPAQTTNNEPIPPPPIGKLVDVGGYRVHLYCTGSGSPAVVIVGAGYSFDWGLVQPEVAKFTQVCSYDHSGIGWSDDGPKDSCSLRVSEVHTALKNAGIKGPHVLVGHSLGGLVARVYAGRFPEEVAGMVFVDHSPFSLLVNKPLPPPPSPKPPTPAGSGKLPSGGIESDPNFSRLSARDRELHLWAIAQPRLEKALQENHEMMAGCVQQADAIIKEQTHPLGDKPLVDVSTDQHRSTDYVNFQGLLLSLSQNSKEMVAENSSHLVIIDRPGVVIDAISRVVQSVHNNAKL